ncbi:MAG: AMP-binding protein [Paludibacteraceae bacterium]|nr:AMP-binding protein [Paludibacteraceae bacterium]
MVKDNLIRYFEDAVRMNWTCPAMSDYGHQRVFTYADVAERIEKIHILLAQCGIKKDDKVALLGRNSSFWAMTYVGVVTYGAVIVPILQDFKPSDVTHIINHSGSRVLFSGDALWEALDINNMPELMAVLSLTDFSVLAVQHRTLSDKEYKDVEKKARQEQKKQKIADEDVVLPPHEVPILDVKDLEPETIDLLFNDKFEGDFHKDKVRYDYRDNKEVGSINYTSGTTGFSKGVITPLNALAAIVQFGISTKICYRGSRFLSFLPLAHAYGCAFDFLCNFCAGGYTCYYGRPLAAQLLMRAFSEIKPTTIFTVPLIIEKIYKKIILPLLTDSRKSWVFAVPGLSDAVLLSIKKKLVAAFGGEFTQVIIGGAPLNTEVEAFFSKIHFPLTVGYGMTECAPLISFSPYNEFIPSSCGKVLPLMQVRVNTPNSEGVGELEVRGENVMYGYYKNDSATRDTFSDDGWLKTGDLGMVSDEGVIFIKGRNKTMLLGPSGQNIYPEELEAKLDNMPYITESLVMQHNDTLVALVYPDMEAVDTSHLTDQQLHEVMEQNRKEVNSQVASYEQISTIRIYPHEFEKTPKKSIKRYLYNPLMGV